MRQRIKMAGFAPGLAYKLAASLVNDIKINLHSIIVFVLVFELHVNIAFLNKPDIEAVFHCTQKRWIEIKFM